ncbi:outer envelope pore protein 16-2, chloroplastic-like [Impatiens glandulifera]|uniref:outer envelope pore protein 16-2, chloroplastic-like n=1 Tax=Impatiens glandulifera TaxID=253017 RepID=UPI001FB18149|nr:outer envelope pore protein 16-2, chloroplastic-like [Impatiens glandulifera]
MTGGGDLKTRTLLNDVCDLGKCPLFDLGHPLLNRVTESFVKAAGIGLVQSVSREAYFAAMEGSRSGGDNGGLPSELSGPKKQQRPFPDLRGETNNKSVEALVKNTGIECMQWGLAAGMYSGLTYGLKEARGTHDWKNSVVAGAVTGAMVGLTIENSSHEQVMQCAITGAAISTAANLLQGIF